MTGQVLKIILNNFFVNSGAISARPLFKKNIHLRNAKMANKIQVYFHKAGGGLWGFHMPLNVLNKWLLFKLWEEISWVNRTNSTLKWDDMLAKWYFVSLKDNFDRDRQWLDPKWSVEPMSTLT